MWQATLKHEGKEGLAFRAIHPRPLGRGGCQTYSALKALKEIRSQYPQLIAPIKSELDSFKDMHSESPSLSSHDRCKVFVMAAYCENDFIEWIINWIHCERGSELMDDAKDLKKLLNEKEIKELTQSLNTMNTPQSLELATLLTP